MNLDEFAYVGFSDFRKTDSFGGSRRLQGICFDAKNTTDIRSTEKPYNAIGQVSHSRQ